LRIRSNENGNALAFLFDSSPKGIFFFGVVVGNPIADRGGVNQGGIKEENSIRAGELAMKRLRLHRLNMNAVKRPPDHADGSPVDRSPTCSFHIRLRGL
jgi:hypothetical protein